jgi:hypothetical protein
MDKPTCIVNIVDKSQTRVNEFGHTVYDFYPNRKFDGNVLIGYFHLEIAYIEEVVELFWLFDSLNIKVTVLGSKNQLPMWSLYSHEMISVTDDNKVVILDRGYGNLKNIYYEAGHVDLCPGLSSGRRWHYPGIQHYRDDIKRLTNGGWKDVYDIDEKDWFLFRSKKMHEYYHNRQPSIWVEQSAYDGYERVVDHFGFDDSPKIDIEVKWTKLKPTSLKYLGEGAVSVNVHEAVRKLLSDGCEDRLFNYDMERYLNPGTKTDKNRFLFTRTILELTDCSLSTVSIILSLKNGFSYVSSSGASSYFYLMPTNMLWAEHLFWHHYWYKNNEYFIDRWLQKLYTNKTEYFSTLRKLGQHSRPRRDKDTGLTTNKEQAYAETLENVRYIEDTYTADYFYNRFNNYIHGSD